MTYSNWKCSGPSHLTRPALQAQRRLMSCACCSAQASHPCQLQSRNQMAVCRSGPARHLCAQLLRTQPNGTPRRSNCFLTLLCMGALHSRCTLLPRLPCDGLAKWSRPHVRRQLPRKLGCQQFLPQSLPSAGRASSTQSARQSGQQPQSTKSHPRRTVQPHPLRPL